MSVAIIIPCLNSPIIEQVLAAVLAQAGIEQVVDLLVVGKDKTGTVAKMGPPVRLLDTGQPVLAARARNLGLAATPAGLLIFLDSDCVARPGWLMGHLAAHQAGHRVVSGGVDPAGCNYWHLVYNLTLFHELLSSNPAGPRDFLATLNLSVERSVIEQIGGMNDNIDRVEDVDWTTRMRRAGIQPYFWPTATIYHNHNRTQLAQVWRDCAISGHQMRWLRLQHPDLLQAPNLLRFPRLLLWLSPLIAAWATGRIIRQRIYLLPRFWHTLPAIYLTKIAWCWGASRPQKPA